MRREQFAWRLIDGKAQYLHYRIFDEPQSTDLPPVDGVRNSRCEYGLEILITLAYLVYWTGMSIDKACEILAFFTGLELSKAQADSLLSQLAADWQIEYDAIAQLVAVAAILYVDQTGWKVGKPLRAETTTSLAAIVLRDTRPDANRLPSSTRIASVCPTPLAMSCPPRLGRRGDGIERPAKSTTTGNRQPAIRIGPPV